MNWIVPLIIGLAVGVALTWALTRRQQRDSLEMVRQQINEASNQSLAVLQEQLSSKDAEIRTLRGLYDAERGSHIDAKAKLEEAQRRLSEQQTFIENIQKQMKDSFASLSQDVLRKVLDDAKGDIGQKQQAIDALLKPINTELGRLQEYTKTLEKDRHGAYTTLLDQVKELKSETGLLSQALRAPKARGRWGEFTLKRVVELAGMVEHCDFHEQAHVEGEEGSLIPDMTVHLPDGKTVVVDAKVPIMAYQDAVNATSDEERQAHLKRHAAHVRKHVKDLSSQTYWGQFRSSPDFVVMFIPGEAYFAAAVEIESGIIEEAIQHRVLISSPIMLVALLRTVAMSWRQSQLEDNANRISELGRELHDRIATFVEHFEKAGLNLGQAVRSYNDAAASLESRVSTQARRFKELGITPKKEIPEIDQVERIPRVLQTDLLPAENGSES